MIGDQTVRIIVSSTPDGRVLLQFAALDERGNFVRDKDGAIKSRLVDHMKWTPEVALEVAEGLVEAAKDAASGRRIMTGSPHETREG